MVFGWGKKKEVEKSVEEIPQNKEILLSDVTKIVNDLYHLRTSQTVSEIKDLRNQTAPLIDDLINIGNVLEKDNLNIDDIDKHLAIIVVRGKKQVIEMIKKGVVPLPEISTIDDAEKLNSSLNQILKKVGDVLGRQTRVIHIFAKKYANQLKENLEVMNNNHSEIQKILENFEFTKSTSVKIDDLLNRIETLKSSRIEKTQKIIETKKTIESLQEKISSIHDSIEEIKSSDNYKKYLDLKNKLESFASQKSKIENTINTQFTKISRPLSRYEYSSSLDKDQKNILNLLVNDTFNALIPQNKDSIIVILENIRKGISSGSISVKDVDRMLLQITETEESIDGFVKRVSEYFDQYNTLQKNMNSLKPDALDSLEREFAKNTSFKQDSELKSETFQGEIDDADLKLPQLVTEIEEKLRAFSNTRYAILES